MRAHRLYTDNIFVIQDGIAASVAEALKITLLEGETTQRVQKWDDEAQRLYQQGRYFYDRTGPDDAFKANELLKRSVEIDSNQSISYLYLAVSYGNLAPLQKSAADANRLREKQKSYLEKALILDPNLSSARAIKALLYAWDHKFIDAVREIDLALSNGSTSPMTLRTAARLYVDWGKPEKAIEYAKKAMELDPLQTRSLLFASETYFYAHNYSGARAILDKALRIDPSNALYRLLLWTSLKEKKVDEASEIIKYIKDPNSRIYDSLLVSTFAGNKSRTHQLAFENQNFDSYEKAVLYAIAQNPDEAIKYLEVAFHQRNSLMVHLATDPFLDPIRTDTRFKKLLERMNYPKLK